VDKPSSKRQPQPVTHLVELGYRDRLELETERRCDAAALEASLKQAQALVECGSVVEAIALLEEVAQQWPQAAPPRWMLAQAEFRAGNVSAAETHLFWLQMHGFERADFSLLWAQIALKQRRLSDAVEHAQYARFLRQRCPSADVIVGDVHFRRGELDQAAAEFQRALDHDERNAAALAGLAAVALRRGDAEAAVDFGLRSVERDMGRASAHYRLGLALLRLGHPDEARAALEAAMRIEPQLRGPRRWLERL
jgi:tetratricopeptide (TPR) repeat protein